MKKTLNVECCAFSNNIRREYNLGEGNYSARIIYDPELASEQMNKAQRAFEANQAEVQAKNAEIQERNKVAEAECARKKSVLTSIFISVWLALSFLVCYMFGIKSFRGMIAVSACIAVVEALLIFAFNANFDICPEYMPEETLDYSKSIEDFYTIHEKFVNWWKDDFSVLKVRFDDYDYYYHGHSYSIYFEVADADDEVHRNTLGFSNKPNFIVKRNQDYIEFNLIENLIVVPYVAR